MSERKRLTDTEYQRLRAAVRFGHPGFVTAALLADDHDRARAREAELEAELSRVRAETLEEAAKVAELVGLDKSHESLAAGSGWVNWCGSRIAAALRARARALAPAPAPASESAEEIRRDLDLDAAPLKPADGGETP